MAFELCEVLMCLTLPHHHSNLLPFGPVELGCDGLFSPDLQFLYELH